MKGRNFPSSDACHPLKFAVRLGGCTNNEVEETSARVYEYPTYTFPLGIWAVAAMVAPKRKTTIAVART
jgi:hypothetical protein